MARNKVYFRQLPSSDSAFASEFRKFLSSELDVEVVDTPPPVGEPYSPLLIVLPRDAIEDQAIKDDPVCGPSVESHCAQILAIRMSGAKPPKCLHGSIVDLTPMHISKDGVQWVLGKTKRIDSRPYDLAELDTLKARLADTSYRPPVRRRTHSGFLIRGWLMLLVVAAILFVGTYIADPKSMMFKSLDGQILSERVENQGVTSGVTALDGEGDVENRTAEAGATTAIDPASLYWNRGGAVAAWVVAVVTTVAVTFAMLAIQQQTENSKAEKTADAIFQSNIKYQSLHEIRTRIVLGQNPYKQGGLFQNQQICAHQCQRVVANQKRQAGRPDLADIIELRDCTASRKAVGFSQLERKCAIAVEYFSAFWSIQYDEWNYFQLGFVPRKIFTDWCVARSRDFSHLGSHPDILAFTFAQGWTECARGGFLHMGVFAPLVDCLREIGDRAEMSYHKNVSGGDEAYARRLIDLALSEALTLANSKILLQQARWPAKRSGEGFSLANWMRRFQH